MHRSNLHPARGRKPFQNFISNRSSIRSNLHPARGRKPFILLKDLDQFIRSNLHPARGRKLGDVSCKSLHFLRSNLHPARGRKPSHFVPPFHNKKEAIYTPQGDGNHIWKTLLLNFREAIYTPQGDGNGIMIRNSSLSQKQFIPRQGTDSFTFVRDSTENRTFPRKGTVYKTKGRQPFPAGRCCLPFAFSVRSKKRPYPLWIHCILVHRK